jgi:hypothetical protein
MGRMASKRDLSNDLNTDLHHNLGLPPNHLPPTTTPPPVAVGLQRSFAAQLFTPRMQVRCVLAGLALLIISASS